jgi:hypothetical protein
MFGLLNAQQKYFKAKLDGVQFGIWSSNALKLVRFEKKSGLSMMV